MKPQSRFGNVLLLALLVLISGGCARQQPTQPAGFSKVTISSWPYQTKPIWLSEGGGMFYWYVTSDRKMIGYEPCCGTYAIEMLIENNSKLIFRISESRGRPLDLRNGRTITKSDVVGKTFEAKIEGNQIAAVAEVSSVSH